MGEGKEEESRGRGEQAGRAGGQPVHRADLRHQSQTQGPRFDPDSDLSRLCDPGQVTANSQRMSFLLGNENNCFYLVRLPRGSLASVPDAKKMLNKQQLPMSFYSHEFLGSFAS